MKSSEKDIFGDKSKELQADIEKTRGEIGQLIFGLYKLTKGEIQQIQGAAGD